MQNNKKKGNAVVRRSALALAILLCGASMVANAPAQTSVAPAGVSVLDAQPLTLREAAQLAVLNNPEVLQRWHQVRASEGERDAARGGLFPRVDLNASTGPERRSDINGGRYSTSSGSLSLTQLLYDGFATLGEVRRLDHATRVRVFELVAASETIALEAARAYFDVLRYRELVQLAEENFVEHRSVYAQTEQRVKARVARAVDLEQITGRLALAEANLLIETANLHDTTARFQRIIGRLPPRDLQAPPAIDRGLPQDVRTALVETTRGNAAVLAAIENVRAANAALEVRQSAYVPRVDFRLRRDQGRNLEGIPGSTNASVAELVLNWNLFNGLADRARERQFAEQVNVARDVRDKTCRDNRQTTMIAFNDIVKLKEQLDYLSLHESSLGRALVAYRLQFQIGQRSLLDLLDSENERFQARRALVNARRDLDIAYVRTQAGVGNLLQALQLSRLGSGMDDDLRSWSAGMDAVQQCPADPVATYTVDKDALVQRALQNIARNPPPQLAQLQQQQLQQQPSVAPAPAAAAPTPAPVPAADASAQVRDALEGWRAAWARKDVAGYLAAYGKAFVPAGGLSRSTWEQRRAQVLGRSANIRIDLADAQTTLTGPDTATSTFVQAYRSDSHTDRVRKTLQWQREQGRWVIVGETSEPLAGR
jgi:adhesin transport system outer membrane protein